MSEIDPEFRCGVCDACDDGEGDPCAVVALTQERDAAESALASARAEMEAADIECDKGMGESYRLGYIRGAETARRVAFEEAAQKVALDWLDTFDRRVIADRLRAMAPLDSSLVLMRLEDAAKTGETLARLRMFDGLPAHEASFVEEAIALLSKAAK